MDIPLWLWAASAGGVLVLLCIDFFGHVRTPHEPTFRESAVWSTFYVVLALVFGAGLTFVWGPDRGAEYFAGYVTEKSLSVDNLFVFLLIMTRFAVPRAFQQKVLLVGVAIALVLRGLFIWAGAAAIEQFSWTFYVFGAFLVWTAVKVAREGGTDPAEEFKEGFALRAVRSVVPTTPDYHGDRLTALVNGRRVFTPMLIVMVAIGTTDLLFALDSIPAIYGLTTEPYIVFMTNAFALLGLRQLYFLVGGLLERLVHLSHGLVIILGFIGIKLVLEAMHTNDVPFLNGGEPFAWAPRIPIWLSLTVILGTLVVVTISSLLTTRRRRAAPHGEAETPVPTRRASD